MSWGPGKEKEEGALLQAARGLPPASRPGRAEGARRLDCATGLGDQGGRRTPPRPLSPAPAPPLVLEEPSVLLPRVSLPKAPGSLGPGRTAQWLEAPRGGARAQRLLSRRARGCGRTA